VKSKTVLFLYKETAVREQAFRETGALSYHLYGLPELQKEGYTVEAASFGAGGFCASRMAGVFGRLCQRLTGYHGNFFQIFSNWKKIRNAGALVLTSNNVSIPVLFLDLLGFRMPPRFVVSVGLESYTPDRDCRRRRMVARIFNRASRMVVFSESEKNFLVERVRVSPGVLAAIPFGISPDYLPSREILITANADWDLITVGADAKRDIPLLLDWIGENPDRTLLMILGEDLVKEFGDLPANVTVKTSLSLEEVFAHLSRSRAAVIPVRQNHYSAGTTFLIHAVACSRPVLVANTDCLGPRYNIDASGCLTYTPGDAKDFDRGMKNLLALSAEEKARRADQGRQWLGTTVNGGAFLKEVREFLNQNLDG